MLVCREVIQPSIILILMEIQTLPLSRQIGPMKIHTNNETNIGHNPDMILFNENHLFCNLNKYIKQFGQIYLSIWTNIFVNLTNILGNLDKYICQFGQIYLSIWTNILGNLDKYICQFGQIRFRRDECCVAQFFLLTDQFSPPPVFHLSPTCATVVGLVLVLVQLVLLVQDVQLVVGPTLQED